MAGRLTKVGIEALVREDREVLGRHTDGDGLHLHVRASGEPNRVLRYRLHGRQRDLVIGTYPTVTLKDARARVFDAHGLIRQGQDPILERRREAVALRVAAKPERSFRGAAKALIDSRQAVWKSAKHQWQWEATLEKHAFPVLGDLPLQAIGVDEVLRVLEPVWRRTPETASRLRGRIEAVLDYARARGWRSGENPARWRGNLADLLPSRDRLARVKHHPALPWADVPGFLAALAKRDGMAPLALQFLILSAARTSEVRGLQWREINWADRVWVVPAERMKMGELHRVPISNAMLAVLQVLRPPRPRPDVLVFPSRTLLTPLSDMSMSVLVRGMATDGVAEGELPRCRDVSGRVIVPHGFRSSFRDWCGETREEGREVAERALAHVVRGVEGAYAQSDLLERRRPLMEAWGKFCSRPATTSS
jgi:integrase